MRGRCALWKAAGRKKEFSCFYHYYVFAGIRCACYILSIYEEAAVTESVYTPTTEAEKLIAKDLDKGYPETPKEVVKLFSRFNQCIYNKKLDDDEFTSLVSQLQKLYCEDLKKKNSLEKMEKVVKADADKYRSENRKIVNYTIDEERNYEYKTIDGSETVYIKYSYFMREGTKYSTWNQRAVLVKENGVWKILGFGSAPAKSTINSKSK